MDLKKCSTCKCEKGIDQFHKSNGRHKYGVVSRCKQCVSNYSKARGRDNVKKEIKNLREKISYINSLSMKRPDIKDVLKRQEEYINRVKRLSKQLKNK